MTERVEGRQLVLCGLGGQGIVFLSRVLAEAAVLDGDAVLTAETHGMSQRGGAVEAHLKLGDFASSLVRPGSADAVLALHETRIGTARGMLRPDGACFANAPEAHPGAATGAVTVDVGGIAQEMAFERGQNLALLAFAAGRRPDLFPSKPSLLAALEALSPPAAVEDNRRAFGRGGELA